MSWSDRTNEERLIAEVHRYREALTAIVTSAKDFHLGTCQHIAENNLAQNHVKDIINDGDVERTSVPADTGSGT